jgi:hypothetical protein
MAHDENLPHLAALAREMDDPNSPTRRWLAHLSAQMDDPESPIRKQLAAMEMQAILSDKPKPTFWQEIDAADADRRFWDEVFGESLGGCST